MWASVSPTIGRCNVSFLRHALLITLTIFIFYALAAKAQAAIAFIQQNYATPQSPEFDGAGELCEGPDSWESQCCGRGMERHHGDREFGDRLERECVHAGSRTDGAIGPDKPSDLLCEEYSSGRREHEHRDGAIQRGGQLRGYSYSRVQRTGCGQSCGCGSGCDGYDRQQQRRGGDDDERQRPHLWGQYSEHGHHWSGVRIYKTCHHHPRLGYCRGQNSLRDRQLQCDRTADRCWTLGDADGSFSRCLGRAALYYKPSCIFSYCRRRILLSDHSDEQSYELQCDEIACGTFRKHQYWTYLWDSYGVRFFQRANKRHELLWHGQRRFDPYGERGREPTFYHELSCRVSNCRRRILLSNHSDEQSFELQCHGIACGTFRKRQYWTYLRDPLRRQVLPTCK